jgi:hypothetical protein
MKRIPLTQGFFTLVDDEDFEELSKFNWHFARGRKTNYAARGVRVGGKMKRIYLHRQLLNAPKGVEIDHEDGDGLNNRRGNVRFASRAQNTTNRPKIRGRSKYKGVSQSIRPVGWKASIRAQGRGIHLGYFRIEEDAARAYNTAAQKFFGKFARLNSL